MNPMQRPPTGRDYPSLRHGSARAIGLASPAAREPLMRRAADALWAALSPQGASWIGFYVIAPDRASMILGACRDAPACSPIALHGLCGRGWTERRAIVVRDVTTLGANYIACDRRDRSELVVPLFEIDGSCWGVLDADSREPASFSPRDAQELADLMEHLGLSAPIRPRPQALEL